MTFIIAKCPSCLTVFELDPAKIPIEGVRARCSICSAVIVVPPVSTASAQASTLVATPTAHVEHQQSEPHEVQTGETLSEPITDTQSADRPPEKHIEAPRRRPVNQFLTRDPAVRAKRLARALVSDIVAYYPEKHAEALRDGTLKATFREEIRKSFEEYVGQVGREFAESTTHFHEALNDVLAGGNKQF